MYYEPFITTHDVVLSFTIIAVDLRNLNNTTSITQIYLIKYFVREKKNHTFIYDWSIKWSTRSSGHDLIMAKIPRQKEGKSEGSFVSTFCSLSEN